MKRGFAIITIATLLGLSAPIVYADTQPATASVSSGNSSASSYTVQSGDTLWKIAQTTGVPVSDIVSANDISNPNSLQVGQVLTIPKTYTVQSGDTLWKIAQAQGVSVQALVQANGLTNADQLTVGQVLVIPTASGSAVSSASTTSTVGGNTTYTVKSGDTLWKLAQTTGTSVQMLVQANNLANADQLFVGQVLVIPAATGSSTPTGSTASNSTTSNNSSATSTYTVRSGDTLWKIAQATGTSVQALVQANSLSNPDSLTVGEVLTIPAATSTGSSNTTGSTPSTDSTSTTGSTTATTASVGSVVLTAGNGGSSKVNQSLALSLTVKDAQGNTITVPQNEVTYTITGANPGTNPMNANIDSSTQQFTATQPGIYACVAKVDGVQSQPLNIQVFGPPATLNVSVDPNLVTGSYTLVPLNFVVVDSMGQPIMSTPVTITVSNPSIAGISLTNSGPINPLPSTVTTSSGFDGSGTVWLRAGSGSGAANVVVTCGGLTKTIPITAASGPAKLTASVAQSSVIANTKFSDLVTIHAYNADGTPAVGYTLSPDYPLGLMKGDGSSVVTNSQGVAQFNVYENNTSTGTTTVGARTANASADVPVAVVPGADATQSTATLPSDLTLGQTYVAPVTVKDASGNPVLHLDQAAFDLHFQGTDGVYDSQGDVSELGNGQYQVTFFAPANNDTSNMASMRKGNYLVSLMVNGVQVGSSQSVNVTNATYPAQTQPNSAPNIALTFPQKLIVNSQFGSLYAMQIKVTDANGNPVANQEVSLSSNNTNVATPAVTTVTTDANGLATAGMTAGFMPGTATITAMTGTSRQTIAVQTVAEPTSITLSAPTSTVASNGGSVTVTAKVLNADGTPASDIALQVFSVTSYSNGTSSSGSMAPDSILTDANGVATFQVTPSDFTSGNTLNVQVADNNDMSSNRLTFTLN